MCELCGNVFEDGDHATWKGQWIHYACWMDAMALEATWPDKEGL